MTENIRVTCLIDRYWDPALKEFDGATASGLLIDTVSQSDEANAGKLIPAGIVKMDDGTFQSIPMEFISVE